MPRISLRSKFLGGTMAIVLLLGLVMVVYVMTALRARLDDDLMERGVFIARDLANDGISPILTEKSFELEMLIRDHRAAEDDIEYVFFLNARGDVLAHTFEKGFPVDLRSLNPVGGEEPYSVRRILTERGLIIDIAVPILSGRAGVMHLGISEEPVRRAVEDIVRQVVWAIVIVILAGSVLAAVFDLAITRPIARLARAARAVGGGDLGARVDVGTNDEIGDLAASFNEMIDKRREAEREREEVILQLRQALEEVKTLKGLLPICSYCRRIRNDRGRWETMETYIGSRSEARFSHGICPDCMATVLPTMLDEGP